MQTASKHGIDLLVTAVLIALAAAIYLQTAHHDYLGYDDPFYVTDNPIVQRGLTWEGTRWAFFHSQDAGGTWAPLTFLTHMLDCQLYGLKAGGHHLTNVLLHAANSVLLYLALLALTGGQRWRSALTAVLFAVHPLHVESVAWIAERKDLLSGFFFILCLWAYALYARRPTLGWYLLVNLALLFGLMSKPMLVTVPALLLVLDFWPLKRNETWKRLLLEKMPMILLVAATAILTIVTQRTAGFVRTLDQFPLRFRLSNAIVSYVRYVGKTIWPFNLAAFYPPPPYWSALVVVACAVALVLITVFAVTTRRRAPYLTTGWFWFLGTLVPVIGLVQVGRQAMADRYSYIPQIGLLITASWAAGAVAERSLAAKQTVIWLTSIALIVLTIRATDQTRHWQNTETLAVHALRVTENNNVALVLLGNADLRRGEIATAEALYREALRIDPDYGMAHLNLGNILVRQRKFPEAAEHYEAAIRWRPQLEKAQLGLGVALRGLRDYDRSDRAFAEALRLAPRLVEAHLAWGLSLEERNQKDAATEQFKAAIALDPQNAVARHQLAALTKSAATTSSTTRPAPAQGK